MYKYFSTIIVKESSVHTNIASLGIEKEKRTPLAWPHRESNKELETRTLDIIKHCFYYLLLVTY